LGHNNREKHGKYNMAEGFCPRIKELDRHKTGANNGRIFWFREVALSNNLVGKKSFASVAAT